MIETSESPKQDSIVYRIAWGILGFLAGASLFCVLAALNKHMTGAPMTTKSFLAPILFGGAAGVAIGMLFIALKRRIRKQEVESARLRQAENALREVRRLESLSVLAGGIAHDFNNLLQGMLGYAELARAELAEGSRAYQMIEQIEEAGRRAAHLSKQMLAYSGKGAFMVSRLDLAGLVAAQADTLASIALPHARLERSFPDDLPPVTADAKQLTQVLQNLVTNATEAFTDSGGGEWAGDTDALITICLSVVDAEREDLVGTCVGEDLPAGRYVRLDVIDNGCGMDAETVTRVFDPFFTTKFPGRGLGMAATLGIVRGHKGTIRVASEVGRGTTVTVLLPAVEPEPTSRV